MWKSVKVASLEAQLARQADRIEALQRERDYWKTKTERLLDMALFKRGEITAPVFEERRLGPEKSPMLAILGAMNTREIDSRPHASTAAPVTPMP